MNTWKNIGSMSLIIGVFLLILAVVKATNVGGLDPDAMLSLFFLPANLNYFVFSTGAFIVAVISFVMGSTTINKNE